MRGLQTLRGGLPGSFGANYKAAYCLSVCPAGEEIMPDFVRSRPDFLNEFLRPLQSKSETVYVIPDSDAEHYVRRRFPHKKTKRVGHAVLRPRSLAGFLRSLPFGFQPGRSSGLSATYHFRFSGTESAECTVTIADKKLRVTGRAAGSQRGCHGKADLEVLADGKSWIRFLRKEVGLPRLLLTGRLRLKGPPRLLAAFGRCFP